MECPNCGRKCFEGVVKAERAGSIANIGAMMSFTPEYEKGNLIKKDKLWLNPSGVGYYCQFCEKAYATFELGKTQTIFHDV